MAENKYKNNSKILAPETNYWRCCTLNHTGWSKESTVNKQIINTNKLKLTECKGYANTGKFRRWSNERHLRKFMNGYIQIAGKEVDRRQHGKRRKRK